MSAIRDISVDQLLRYPLPSLARAADKDGRGEVLVVAGGAQVPGAGVLTGPAARAGAGKLQLSASATGLGIAVPEAAIVSAPATTDGEISPAAASVLAEVASRADAIVVGPGMMDETGAAKLGLALIKAADRAAFVLDAAGHLCTWHTKAIS